MVVDRAWLLRQRWFAGKGRTIHSTAETERIDLADGIAVSLLEVIYEDGGREEYQLIPAQGLPDGVHLPEVQRTLFDLLAQRGRLPARLHAERMLAAGQAPAPRLLTGEQSNSSIAFGEEWILKVLRRPEHGPNRDWEIGRFLTEARFPDSPGVGACLSLGDRALAILQRFVPNRGDCWKDMLERLKAGEELQDEAARLGEVTGRLHAALGSRPDLPDFAPEPVPLTDEAGWLDDMRRQLNSAVQAGLDRHTSRRGDFEAAIERLAGSLRLEGVLKIQIHGDYHLGQVLKTEDGFSIIDFEGEPARPLAERRAKQPPARDAAGMLRSLDYAACTAGRDGWSEPAGRRFVEGWLHGSQARYAAGSPDVSNRLLEIFQLSKALYELNYELNNRPEWLWVPLRGIDRLMDRMG